MIFKNGDYFIGKFKNDLRNGRGLLCTKGGKISYEGEWVDDEMEGNGKFIIENVTYYIGQFKKGLFNGKGIFYNKNGNKKYEGQWIDGIIKGKGILYSKDDGRVLYEGEWVDGIIEGSGKYVFENGNYYIIYFKNNTLNGKGIVYYKNGNIQYEGEYVDGKM